MKNILLAALMLVAAAVASHADPYVAVYGTKYYPLNNPAVSVDACVDPVNVGNTGQCSTLMVAEHKSTSSYFLFKGEAWGVDIGYVASGAFAKPLIGLKANLAPASLDLLASGLEKLAPDARITQMVSEFADAPATAISGSFGPQWRPPLWSGDRGALYLAAGAALKF